MFDKYFQQELANLRELGAEFSKAHPALAPTLGGQRSDPDVERLLEGVAFLTGLLREKLDDEFPELVQGLTQLIFPHYLRPLPSATIIQFTPKPNLKNYHKIPSGANVASQPIEGTQCIFKTCFDVDAFPMRMVDAAFEQPPGKPPSITLTMEVTTGDLPSLNINKLKLHIAKDYPTASNIYYLLMNKLRNIIIRPMDSGSSAVLDPEHLSPAGFSDDEAMISYPAHSFSGYRLLQEYFLMPEKFLFVDLSGWERWTERGTGTRFQIVFELKDLATFTPPRVERDNFVLFATPAINIYNHEAEPILLDHRHSEYRVHPSGTNKLHHQVYSVDKVSGFMRGAVSAREYKAFELFHSESSDTPVYHATYGFSPVSSTIEVLLSFTYPPDTSMPSSETLTIMLTCTNGNLTEAIQIGDISRPTSNSPDLVDYSNIRPPTASVAPPLGKVLLWKFMSLYSLNYLPLANKDNVQALLKLYIFTESKDKVSVYANNRKVEGISDMEVKTVNQLVSGFMMRGQEIKLKLLSDHFGSDGDLYLFGSVMDHFFGSYSNINTFTKFVVEEVIKGESYRWPARLGDRPLI